MLDKIQNSISDDFRFLPSDWGDLRDTDGEKEPGEIIREMREKCERLWREHGPEAWRLIEQEERRLTGQIDEAEQELARLDGGGNDDHRRRVRLAQLVADGKRRAVLRFLRSHSPLDVPPGGDTPEPDDDDAPVIEGRHAPEYALEARDVLNEHPAISSFTKLAAQMGPSGESKVGTLKRTNATGYNDLPREEKPDFPRFKQLLLAGVERLEG